MWHPPFLFLTFSFPYNYNSNCLNSNILSIVSACSAMLPVRTAWTLPAMHKRRNIPMYAQKLSFHYLSMSVHAMFHRRLLDSLKCRQLTAGQPKVLDYLQDHNGATQKEIAAACHIEPGSLTAVLNRMEQKNMIQRRMLDGNRRSLHVFLTPLRPKRPGGSQGRLSAPGGTGFSGHRQKRIGRYS